jgi:hypothetical protein
LYLHHSLGHRWVSLDDVAKFGSRYEPALAPVSEGSGASSGLHCIGAQRMKSSGPYTRVKLLRSHCSSPLNKKVLERTSVLGQYLLWEYSLLAWLTFGAAWDFSRHHWMDGAFALSNAACPCYAI